jgi:hypothetical protein
MTWVHLYQKFRGHCRHISSLNVDWKRF